MSSKSGDKKQQILKITMQLFATKGASATSMQEIAELCGISKGSLYLHFKSKEELELHLYDYCYQMLHDQLMQVENQSGLSPRDKMIRQVEALLELVFEFREFLLMQLRDWLKNGNVYKKPDIIRNNNSKLLKFCEKIIIATYGEEILPYLADLITIIHGMLGTFIHLLFIPRLNITTHRMASYLVHMLDVIIDNLLLTQPTPLISREVMHQLVGSDGCLVQPERHPLLAIKELKGLISNLDTTPEIRDQGLESIQILEQEMIELHPRLAILMGMLANLKGISELEAQVAELEDLMQPYLQR
ncbi:Biofilm operon icaADBC HTH-type negative transcriptional regulator IcaR [compost metagenome]